MRPAHVATALVVLLVVAGCQGQPTPTTSASLPASSPAPSADEPVQERETGLIQPKQVFGGDCSLLFSTDEVSAAVGATMTVVPPADIFDNAGIIDEQNGGLRCAWKSDPYSVVDVLVLPAEAVSYDEPDTCGSFTESGIPACTLEATANGIRMSGMVGRIDAPVVDMEAAKQTLLALFTERATPANVAPVPIPAAGSWAFPVECESVVAAADLSGVPGLGADSTGYSGAGGSDAYYPPAVQALWGPHGLPHCGIDGESVFLDFDASGGGRWKESELSAAPAVPLVAEAFDAAYAVPLSDGRFRIHAFNGPNWISFDVTFTKNAVPIATALIAALDATAIP